MPRSSGRWITAQLTEDERLLLEKFCEQEDRTITSVIRELVKTLKPKLKRES